MLFARFRDQFPQKRPTPQGVLKFLDGDPELIRRVGLSLQKAAYLRDLSQHFVDGQYELVHKDYQVVVRRLEAP